MIMKKKKIRRILQLTTLMCAAALFAMTPKTVQAQDFYGEGNVLIAVDMGPYAENEEFPFPDGGMGELKWGVDAPTGVSTRAQFDNKKYNPSNTSSVKAPDYKTMITYTVGQKVVLPYFRTDDPDFADTNDPDFNGFFPKDVFLPEDLPDDIVGLFIHENYYTVDKNDGTTYVWMFHEKTADGSINPCCDFLILECVAVTKHSTIWQYTGNAYSSRSGFVPSEYGDAVDLTADELRFFTDACDEVYVRESAIYGDPLMEDMRGDRDKKTAFLILNLDSFDDNLGGFYQTTCTDLAGLDCLFINSSNIPGRKTDRSYQEAAHDIKSLIIHEFNHYVVSGCIGHEYSRWNKEMGEAFAESAVYTTDPDNIHGQVFNITVSDHSSRLRMIPGILQSHGYTYSYPNNMEISYSLGPHFLRFIERETTGRTDGRLWAEYFASQTPEGTINPEDIDAFLQERTGESFDAWLAQFMAATVVCDEKGIYSMGDKEVTLAYHMDPNTFFRPFEDYGKNIGSFDGAVDDDIVRFYWDSLDLLSIQGGGTTYAFRNDAGGRIAITGADERWYFFAVNMELPRNETIEIADAATLAKIGKDPGYPLSGSYILTADIDLGGEEHPWNPIGTRQSFTGTFNGNGHNITGLYINTTFDHQGLFAAITGNSVIRDLTVRGEVTGTDNVGGIAGTNNGADITGCTSYVTVRGNDCIGGIAGYHEHGTISDCTAAGTVEGTSACGGIAGQTFISGIENCRNLAGISGKYQVGGITGYSSHSFIYNSDNSGNINADDTVGGITGYTHYGTVISNCRSTGTVSGSNLIGGIVGYSFYSVLENNQHNSKADTGKNYIYDNDRIVFTKTDPDGKSTVFVFKMDIGTQTLSLKKVESSIREIDIPYSLLGPDNTEYTVSSIAKGAFKNIRNASIFIPETVNTLRANTFNGVPFSELIFIVRNASDLKIKPGTFNDIKRPRKTTIKIWTTDKKTFNKVVANFKKAGGENFKYEFFTLEESDQ